MLNYQRVYHNHPTVDSPTAEKNTTVPRAPVMPHIHDEHPLRQVNKAPRAVQTEHMHVLSKT